MSAKAAVLRRVRAPRGPRAVLALGMILLLVGAVVLGAGLYRRHSAVDDVSHAVDGRRDAVATASRVLVGAYTFDYRSVDASLKSLSDSSTGDFLKQQQQWGAQVRQRVSDQKAVTTAKVDNQAVEHFDLSAGTATVLFVFTAESRREKLPPVTGRQAARVDVVREGDAWKVSAVTPVGVVVPVGDSSVAAQGAGGAAPSSTAPASPAAPPAAGGAGAPSSTVAKSPAPRPAPATSTVDPAPAR